MQTVTDNYEKQVLIARKLFLKYDQQKMLHRLPLNYDPEYIYVNMLDMKLRVSRATGEVEKQISAEKYEDCTEYDVVMTVYDVLCYSDTIPILKGTWCPLNSLQVTLSNPDANLYTRTYARDFSGKIQDLTNACRSIGGSEPAVSARADVCWQFQIFPFFPVQFRFWDGDEEFEPKIQLLWDQNSLKFMHFETVYYAMGVLMERLKEAVSVCGK